MNDMRWRLMVSGFRSTNYGVEFVKYFATLDEVIASIQSDNKGRVSFEIDEVRFWVKATTDEASWEHGFQTHEKACAYRDQLKDLYEGNCNIIMKEIK